MLQYEQVARATFMVPKGGRDVTALDADGVVLFVVGLRPGIEEGKILVKYLSEGDQIDPDPEITVLLPGGRRLRRVDLGDVATESGANPDFVPSRATQDELRLRKLVEDVSSKTKLLDRKIAAYEGLIDQDSVAEDPSDPPSDPPADPPDDGTQDG